MRSHKISGMPRKCLNRICDGIFTRGSHLGYLMHSELDVFAVMRCPSCRDTFMINQPISMAHEYYERLPKNNKEAVKNGQPITVEEMRNFRKKLADTKNFKTMLGQDDVNE